ncbi:hypothetical protein JTB14_012472 [Gonioctena quinquepunctata]|nr:hypothetical protein JTB14_012472 [Gonioctena quinquepunctata]
MPRPKPKNPGIGKTTSADMKRAVYDIVRSGLSTKASALRHNIPRTTLRRYLAKCERNRDSIDWNADIPSGAPRMCPNYSVNAIFTREEEAQLGNYLQTMTNLHHGLNPRTARKLAFDLAVANKKNAPIMDAK